MKLRKIFYKAFIFGLFFNLDSSFSLEKNEFEIGREKIRVEKSSDKKSLDFFDKNQKSKFLFKIEFQAPLQLEEVTHLFLLDEKKGDYLIVTRSFLEGPEKSHFWKASQKSVSLIGETECDDHQIGIFQSRKLNYTCFEIDPKNPLKEIKRSKSFLIK